MIALGVLEPHEVNPVTHVVRSSFSALHRLPLPTLLLALGLPCSVLRAQGTSGTRGGLPFDGAEVLRLANGFNAVDVIGDGSTGTVFVAIKENYNAHGYHAVVIAVRPRVPNPDSTAWQLVPAEGDARGAGDVLGTEEGADCTLRDLRLLRRGPGRPLTLVIAQRDLHRSYADPDSVRFTVYELRHNTTGDVGRPTYYFEPTRVIPSRRLYCDVNVAFRRELGVGGEGIAPSDAAARAP